MRRSWKRITLLGGLGFMLIALIMIVATTLQAIPITQDSQTGEEPHGVLREYRDPQLSVRFYYPNTWQPSDNVEGVTVLPESGTPDFIEQGALFLIARSNEDDNDDLPPLPPMLQAVIESENAVRASDNVAVGGVSGTETVVELDAATSTGSLQNAQLASALSTTLSQRLTVIVWRTERADDHIWVIMADARAGEYLSTLQEIRNSIQWE